MTLDLEVERALARQYNGKAAEKVRKALLSITEDHVMAKSETNLSNARRAVLMLAKGDADKAIYFAGRARQDFRDVIYWAQSETAQ
ncbi:MAG: hypothetical protein HKN14_05290 [Marinicaulis sp.]|nr:hypothetical protein [Marinicaulis sp.]NNE40316.1 hypothetical protein [Marinicaulis sp.]NNL89893.1 hypothetical protein [Marinicaulis sp.]